MKKQPSFCLKIDCTDGNEEMGPAATENPEKLIEAAYFNHTATSWKDLKILSEENTISYTI